MDSTLNAGQRAHPIGSTQRAEVFPLKAPVQRTVVLLSTTSKYLDYVSSLAYTTGIKQHICAIRPEMRHMSRRVKLKRCIRA